MAQGQQLLFHLHYFHRQGDRSASGVVRRYCATHQEMREAVARGLAGPGISPLDVMPQTWAHLPGFKEEMEHRRRKIEAIKVYFSLLLGPAG